MPRPGQYREVLIPGLRKMGENELADALEKQDIKLAIANSITGPVQVRRNLTPLFIDAIKQARDMDPEVADYYISGLEAERTVPVNNNCAEINARLANRVYRPGELFLTT